MTVESSISGAIRDRILRYKRQEVQDLYNTLGEEIHFFCKDGEKLNQLAEDAKRVKEVLDGYDALLNRKER